MVHLRGKQHIFRTKPTYCLLSSLSHMLWLFSALNLPLVSYPSHSRDCLLTFLAILEMSFFLLLILFQVKFCYFSETVYQLPPIYIPTIIYHFTFTFLISLTTFILLYIYFCQPGCSFKVISLHSPYCLRH